MLPLLSSTVLPLHSCPLLNLHSVPDSTVFLEVDCNHVRLVIPILRERNATNTASGDTFQHAVVTRTHDPPRSPRRSRLNLSSRRREAIPTRDSLRRDRRQLNLTSTELCEPMRMVRSIVLHRQRTMHHEFVGPGAMQS